MPVHGILIGIGGLVSSCRAEEVTHEEGVGLVGLEISRESLHDTELGVAGGVSHSGGLDGEDSHRVQHENGRLVNVEARVVVLSGHSLGLSGVFGSYQRTENVP